MAENMFSILLKAILDENASASEIKRQIDNLSKKASDVQLGVKIDDKEIERLRREIASIQKSLENDNLTTKERSRLLKEMNQLQRTLNTESRVYNQQNKQDLTHQRTQLSAIASAQKDAVSLKRSQQQLAKMENAEIEKENTNLREQKSLLSSMKTWHSKQTVGSMAQTGLFGVDDLGELKTAQIAYDQLISRIETGQTSIKDARTEFQLLKDGITQLGDTVKKVDEIQHLFDNGYGASEYRNQITKIQQDLEKYGVSANKVKDITKDLNKILGGFKVDGNFLPDDQLIAQADLLKSKIDAVEISIDEAKLAYDKFMQPVSSEKASSLIVRINDFLSKNKNITTEAKEELLGFIRLLQNGNVNLSDWNKFDTRLKEINIEMREANRLGKTLKQTFVEGAKSFIEWSTASGVVMEIVYILKDAVSELKEVDSLLTEISKANDKLSSSDLTEIGDNSFDIASKYGKSATHYLSGVQEASRAGYENAEAIAEMSVAIQGAGDVTEDIANKYVIATDKAYGLKGSVEELTKVFDGTNYITNKNAVNMTELADGMSIVGSTAASFGIEVNETTAALGTMIASTQLSGSEMARAFRAILLNIRQVSDEEEGIDAEGLTKYEEACNALGVSLKETKNGVLQTRDAMEVLRDLSVEYNKLEEGDLRRTQLLNSVGGKLRANALDALLKNYDMYSKMLSEYEEGAGSMAREAEKTANSWEGASTRLSNTLTDIIENVLSSKEVIGAIDFLNTLLTGVNNLTDALGGLGTLALGGSIFAGFKNVDYLKMPVCPHHI